MRRVFVIFLWLSIGGVFSSEAFAQDKGLLSLEDCKAMALSNSAKTRNAGLDTKAADEQRKEVLWEYFPGISIVGGAFHSLSPLIELETKDIISGNSDAAHNLVNQINDRAHELGIDPVYRALHYGSLLNLTVLQPVYAGGRIVNANRLAGLGYDVAVLKESIASREVSQQVEEAFWLVVLLQEKQKTLAVALSLVDSLYKDVSSARVAGLVVDQDLKEVASRRNALRGDEVRLRNGLLLAKMALCNLIGQEYVVNECLATDKVPFIGSLAFEDGRLWQDCGDLMQYYRDEETLCRDLDEVALLSLAERAAGLQRKIALGEVLPQVAVGGSYGYNNLMNHNKFNGMLYATVKIPLTDWGKTAHKARRYAIAGEQAANDREFLSKQLLLQVRKFWMDVVEACEQVEIQKEAYETAFGAFSALQSQYSAGEITLTELLKGQIDLRGVEETYLEARVDYLKALQKYLSL